MALVHVALVGPLSRSPLDCIVHAPLAWQTALRLDVNALLGLLLVLANLRFDSPWLVGAATGSVVLYLVRTIFGYLNTKVKA